MLGYQNMRFLNFMLQLQKVSRFRKEPKPPNNNVKKRNQGDNFPRKQQKLQEQKYLTLEQHFDPEFVYQHFLSSLEDGDRGIKRGSLSYYFEKLYEEHYSIRQFEDSMRTLFLYRKKLLLKFTMMFLSLMSIFLSIWEILGKVSNNRSIILIFQSVLTVFLLAMVIGKYIIGEELKKRQLLRQKYQNRWLKLIKATVPQLLLLILHPNPFTENLCFNIIQPIRHGYIPFQLNVLLEIFMQLRVYLIFSSVIEASIYCNTRAHRLCRIYSTKCSLFFGVKSLFQYRPLTFLVLLYGTTILTFGQMITLSEGQYSSQKGGFSVFQNSLWFVIITMGTVGYGDYSPKTHVGRVISFSSAIVGIIISSLLILTLSRYLAMSTSENKSHVTLRRLELRKVLERYSQETIKFTTQLMFLEDVVKQKATKNKEEDQERLEKSVKAQKLEELKKKTEKVKFTIRRIKNLVDNDNLKEEINCLFESLSESLNDIYKYQLEYAKLLEELYQRERQTIVQEQFCFTTEIQRIIKDR